jgi:hypothetical protein
MKSSLSSKKMALPPSTSQSLMHLLMLHQRPNRPEKISHNLSKTRMLNSLHSKVTLNPSNSVVKVKISSLMVKTKERPERIFSEAKRTSVNGTKRVSKVTNSTKIGKTLKVRENGINKMKVNGTQKKKVNGKTKKIKTGLAKVTHQLMERRPNQLQLKVERRDPLPLKLSQSHSSPSLSLKTRLLTRLRTSPMRPRQSCHQLKTRSKATRH